MGKPLKVRFLGVETIEKQEMTVSDLLKANPALMEGRGKQVDLGEKLHKAYKSLDEETKLIVDQLLEDQEDD